MGSRDANGAGVLAAVATGLLLAAVAVPGAGGTGPDRVGVLNTSSCAAVATKRLVHRFVGDYNFGRLASIDSLWAPAPRFQWFSTSPPGARLGPHAYNRATLVAYFRTRLRLHERIRVTQLGAGYDPKRKIVNFGGKLIRSADDLQPSLRDFKGAADCVSGRPFFIVWSM